ncbi:hypothetical protein ACP275_08G144900 [Erythranthe tilingii]
MKTENGQTVMVPLFHNHENVYGKISVEPVSGKKVEHNGIKVELLGQIALISERVAIISKFGTRYSRNAV